MKKNKVVSIDKLLLIVIVLFLVVIAWVVSSILGLNSNKIAADQKDSLSGVQKLSESKITDDWELILVNSRNNVPDDYDVNLNEIIDNHFVDERIISDLDQMLLDCKNAGLTPIICSSYRSEQKQKELFNNKINRLIAQGYSEETANAEAAKVVAKPGTSEHQLGLAVDIVDINNQNLDKSQESTEVQQWLMKNSWKYGFILRYPNEKSDITGIIYEPWHYRYVGKTHAEQIYNNDLCLEEYLKA